MKKRVLFAIAMTVGAGVPLVVMVACTDPVLDDAITALGPETSQPGPEHRPGQPCVLCHSESGTDTKHQFSLAGTIYETPALDSRGAANVDVRLRAADGSERIGKTNAAGNFYFNREAWDPAFPVHVHIYRPNEAVQRMETVIGRAGSCATCHFEAKDTSYLPDARAIDFRPFEAVGRVYLNKVTP